MLYDCNLILLVSKVSAWVGVVEESSLRALRYNFERLWLLLLWPCVCEIDVVVAFAWTQSFDFDIDIEKIVARFEHRLRSYLDLRSPDV
jgi:hypothetical protein